MIAKFDMYSVSAIDISLTENFYEEMQLPLAYDILTEGAVYNLI